MNRSMAEINEEQYEDFLQEIDTMQEFPPANIIVAGISGVGKSTLLNAVFGKEVAVTGVGRPQTNQAKSYQSSDIPIRIWDTVGFEMSEDGKAAYEIVWKQNITEFIENESPHLTKEQYTALLSVQNTLHELYCEWLSNGELHTYSDIEILMEDTAEDIILSIKRSQDDC